MGLNTYVWLDGYTRTEIEFRPEVLAIQQAFIKATTITGQTAYKEIQYDVRCGPGSNIVYRIENADYRVDVLKNEGNVEPINLNLM